MNKPIGRPTKYRKKFCKEMINFFTVPHTVWVEKQKPDSNSKLGITYYKVEEANRFPTFERFATKIDVPRQRLWDWATKTNDEGDLKFPEFCDAFEKCKGLQKDMLLDLGLRGFYNAHFTKFVAINITDMVDESRVVNSDVKKTPVKVISEKAYKRAELELEEEIEKM